MFSVLAKRCIRDSLKALIPCQKYHVAIAGAANPVGQATALLLRKEPSVTKLTLHDVQRQTAGIIFDLYNIPSSSTLEGYCGVGALEKALHKADIVIAVGSPMIRREGVSESKLIKSNAALIKNLASKLVKQTPQPILGIAVEPINIMVPYTAEVLKENGKYDKQLLYGVTMSDILTAHALLAAEQKMDLSKYVVPVIGGHSIDTIVPLISQARPKLHLPAKYVEEITDKIRRASDIVVMGKRGVPPILSVANGIAAFVRSLTRAMDKNRVQTCGYIENNYFGTEFFSGPIILDENLEPELQCYDRMSLLECDILEGAIKKLQADVLKGKQLHHNPKKTIKI